MLLLPLKNPHPRYYVEIVKQKKRELVKFRSRLPLPMNEYKKTTNYNGFSIHGIRYV
jgi:hypothetical protein